MVLPPKSHDFGGVYKKGGCFYCRPPDGANEYGDSGCTFAEDFGFICMEEGYEPEYVLRDMGGSG